MISTFNDPHCCIIWVFYSSIQASCRVNVFHPFNSERMGHSQRPPNHIDVAWSSSTRLSRQSGRQMHCRLLSYNLASVQHGTFDITLLLVPNVMNQIRARQKTLNLNSTKSSASFYPSSMSKVNCCTAAEEAKLIHNFGLCLTRVRACQKCLSANRDFWQCSPQTIPSFIVFMLKLLRPYIQFASISWMFRCSNI